ncbi:MAG: coproporphyrinogen III oxidase [Crocinitomicaceae bacterium]|nr:coproporphyrinogen III oxidase [Crocinitomicaceae bacterium]
MSGIYLHVPFCRTACHYCDFHFSTSLGNVEAYVESVVSEISLRAKRWENMTFKTLYIGGGTPSVLKKCQLQKIVDAIRKNLKCASIWDEATIEVNPEDVSIKALEGWIECGFNRISIGLQSLDDEQLEWMNRKHSAIEAVNAVCLARKAGFEKISVDLIYGIPFRSENSWNQTVKEALDLQIDHISCYAITVEPQTVLGSWVKKGRIKEAPDTLIEADYTLLCDEALRAGFNHYEVCNWVRGEGNKAVHNSSYWFGAAFLGLGPGAHGFNGYNRYSVVSNNNKYIGFIKEGVLPDTIEKLSRFDRSNEMLMTGLRTAVGVDFDELNGLWGIDHIGSNPQQWKKWVEVGAIVESKNGRHRIAEEFWLIGDSISSDLIVLQS